MIKIETEKRVKSDGTLVYLITKIKALTGKQLPLMYLNSYPHVRLANDELHIYPGNSTCAWFITKGKSYSIVEFEKRLDIIKESGTRLMECNETLAKLRCQWAGKKHFKI